MKTEVFYDMRIYNIIKFRFLLIILLLCAADLRIDTGHAAEVDINNLRKTFPDTARLFDEIEKTILDSSFMNVDILDKEIVIYYYGFTPVEVEKIEEEFQKLPDWSFTHKATNNLFDFGRAGTIWVVGGPMAVASKTAPFQSFEIMRGENIVELGDTIFRMKNYPFYHSKYIFDFYCTALLNFRDVNDDRGKKSFLLIYSSAQLASFQQIDCISKQIKIYINSIQLYNK